jgi:acyl dehydratase
LLVAAVPGRTFEGFTVGEVLEHAARIPVQQEDNVAFCRLTHNNQPLHLDEAYARKSPFGKIVVNGLYTFSLAVGVSVEDTTAGTLVANVGYEDVKHPIPVHPGDTLRFTTEIVDKRPSSKPGRGLVTLLHRAFNQQDQEVCSFKRLVLVQAATGARPTGAGAGTGGRP